MTLAAPEELLAVQRLLVIDTISWRPHLETAMEIALVARDRGAKVRYLNLRALLPAVEDASWLPRAIDLNTLRVGRAKRLLQAAGIDVAAPAGDVASARRRAARMLAGCADTAALCRLEHEGFTDIGWGVLSSVVDMTRNPYVSLQAQPRLFEEFLASALVVYDAARRAIERFSPDAVLLFNGRFATTRPIFAAARQAGVRTLIHDRGCDRNHYWLATESIHDPDYLQRYMREFWRPELAAAGEAFYKEKRDRVERGWLSHTKSQTRGRIPPAMQDSSRWIVFFTSAEDEFVAVGDTYVNKDFPQQIDAVRAVVKVLQELPGHRLCVRMHPNIATKSREHIEFWRDLEIPGGIMVAPEEKFDSYAILDRADVVCTYGSTMGIEATYWGKPSLLTGRAAYDRLGATFNAADIAGIREYLAKPTAFPPLGALIYGAFYSSYGTPFRYYQSEDFFRGRILGTDLDSAGVRFLRAVSLALKRA